MKSQEMDDVIKGIFGHSINEAIASGKCFPAPIGCGGPATQFRDDLSKREYNISGLCQKCQDKVFGK